VADTLRSVRKFIHRESPPRANYIDYNIGCCDLAEECLRKEREKPSSIIRERRQDSAFYRNSSVLRRAQRLVTQAPNVVLKNQLSKDKNSIHYLE
jgi:hypothetical protein